MRIKVSEIAERTEPLVHMDLRPDEIAPELPPEVGQAVAIEDAALDFAKEPSGRLSLGISGLARLVVPCARCLKDVPIEVPVSAEYAFRIEEHEVVEDEEDPLAALSEGILDVDALYVFELLSALPAKVLCREDCKGLCPRCGQDLNRGECGCDRFVPDPRMQKIWDVFSEQ